MKESFSLLLITLRPYVGLIIVFALSVAVVLVARVISRKKQFSPYSRQLVTAGIGTLGLLAAVLVFPVTPETRGQILSLAGILLSAIIALSSQNLMGNAMAGIMLRISGSFRPGDFLEVEDTEGRVFQQGLFSTEIQIITHDVVSIPNLYLIRHSIRVINKEGSFVSAPVSIGYNENRKKVEESLLKAAEQLELEDPFVYVEDLLDHAVVYRVYGFLEDYTRILTSRSDLKKAMLDTLHKNGIEIVSPSFVIRKEISPDMKIIPAAGSAEEKESEPQTESIEERTFDKAEDAANLENLKEEYKKIQKEIENKKVQKSGDADKTRKRELDSSIKTLQKKATRLENTIEELQKEEKK